MSMLDQLAAGETIKNPLFQKIKSRELFLNSVISCPKPQVANFEKSAMFSNNPAM
jgi:hypothetical protein